MRRLSWFGLVRAGAGGVGLVLAAGCGSGAAGSAGAAALATPSVQPSPAPTSYYATEMAMPLMAFESTAGQEVTIAQAGAILTISCMSKAGYSGISEAALTSVGSRAVSDSGPFGFIDPKGGAAGFHPAAATTNQGIHTSSAAEGDKLMSCMSASAKAVSGSASTQFINTLIDKSADSTGADSRVVAATAAWSSCMKGKGFSYADPTTAAQAPWPGGSSSEIPVAQADAACTTSSNLSGIYFPVQAGYQDELIQQNSQALDQVKKDYQQAVTKATAIVAGGGTS